MSQPDLQFSSYSADIDEIIALAAQHDATSVLVDLSDSAAGEAIRTISRSMPALCILALAVDDREANEVVECARLGCHGIISRTASLQDVTRIIRAAESGEVVVPPSVAAKLMQALARDATAMLPWGLPNCLTRREREICTLVCEGLTNKEIALEVNRSLGTVKNHVHSILAKLDLPRRTAILNHLTRAGDRQHRASA